MRSRRSSKEQVADVARRRLELLSAELAEIRPDPVESPSHRDRDGSGEPSASDGAAAAGGSLGGSVAGTTLGPSARPGRHAHRSVGLWASVAGWGQDRLPSTMQTRMRLSVTHLAVVAVVALGGLVFTIWWVTRAGGASTVLPTVAPVPSPLVGSSSSAAPGTVGTSTASSATGAAGAAAGTSSSPVGRVVVDVTGKVRRPGIASLPSGSRVVDAVKAAGGARRGVSLASLNLARVLADGEQIVVGVRAPPGVAASAASAMGSPLPPAATGSPVPMVNINTADQTQLELLPGVGPVTARAILDYRAQQGPFTAVDQMLEVSGIGEATLAKIAPYSTI